MNYFPPSATLFPYTTLFRSGQLSQGCPLLGVVARIAVDHAVNGLDPLLSLSSVFGRIRDAGQQRSEEHTSELQSHHELVCRLLLEIKRREGDGSWRSHRTGR